MKFKELNRKDWFMFKNDDRHYQKDSASSYFCFENRSHHYTSGIDTEILEGVFVIKISEPKWN